ncbi:MAG: hypothetical protein JNK49_02610 [Planctomycetes bacterium]|nr:hypothetical protein [Planctomycetota bacterium]
MLLRNLLLLATLPSLLLAQAGEEEAERVRRKMQALQAEGDLKTEEKGLPDDALEKMTPEQRLNHNIRHGAANLCSFVATPKPAKLMPGQSGVLVVTAILKANAILPAPPPLEMLSGMQQGLVTLGPPAFRPAEPGKLNGFYRGKPVYDNWAIFEVPVTMSPAAEIGRQQPVSLEMKFDLFDANAGQPIGRFIDRVAATIEVGHSADPAAQTVLRSTTPSPAAAAAAAAAPGSGEGDDARRTGNAEPPRTVVVAAPPATVAAPESSAAVQPAAGADLPAPEPVEDAGSVPLPLLVAGAAAVLALVLLLARRRS